eukprot:scaffold15099_cov37-Tisochrysis_lutea.AAC.6
MVRIAGAVTLLHRICGIGQPSWAEFRSANRASLELSEGFRRDKAGMGVWCHREGIRPGNV